MSEQLAAIVTGASRGIGKAIALRLAELRQAVVVNYARRRDAADEVVAVIEQQGGRAIAVQADVSAAADRQRLVDETLQAFGRVDVLVNNAGITSPGRQDLLEATEESWDAVFSTNLKAPFFLSQSVARQMLAQHAAGRTRGGWLINVSSISAAAVSLNRGDYCIAKAAVGMLTQVFAARLAEQGIGVFEISPGVIASDMTEPVREKYDRLIAEGLTPIRRWGEGRDVAEAVAAIVEGRFPFSTGQRFDVDGGFRIRVL